MTLSGDSLFNDHPLAHSMPGAGVVHHVIFDRVCGLRLSFDVRYSPKATSLLRGNEMTRRANNGSRVSFDDLVGGRQQCRRKLQSERSRRCAIEHQFELGWLVERNVTRLRAL